jgi:hypothetical protein
VSRRVGVVRLLTPETGLAEVDERRSSCGCHGRDGVRGGKEVRGEK